MKRTCHKTALLMVCIIIVLLTGCNLQNAVMAGYESSNNSDEYSINIKPALQIATSSSPSPALLALAQAFEDEYGVQIDVNVLRGGAEGDNILKTMLATGDMPDIFEYNVGSLLHAIQPEENLLDLTDEAFTAGFNDLFRETTAVEGRLYGVPTSSVAAVGWYYNKDIYQALGLEVPQTWDQLMNNCRVILDAQIVPIVGSASSTTAQLIFLADAHNVKAQIPDFPEKYTAGDIKFADTPAALRSFEKLEEASKHINTDFLETSHSEAVDMLLSGKSAHLISSSWYAGGMEQSYPEKMQSIGFFPQPGDNPDQLGFTYWLPHGWYIYKNSPHADLAKLWLSYYTSEKGLAIINSYEAPGGPYVIEGVNLPQDIPEAARQVQRYIEAGQATLALEFESPLKGPNCAQICAEVLAGISDAKSAASAYDKDLEKQAIHLELTGWN